MKIETGDFMKTKPEQRRIRFLNICDLHVHERTDPSNLEKIFVEVTSSKKVVPILVDENSLVVLDGHHRLETLRMLGAALVPAVMVDYRRENILVSSRRPGIKVSKDEVVLRGLSNNPYPPKTSKHITDTPILEGIQLSHLGIARADARNDHYFNQSNPKL